MKNLFFILLLFFLIIELSSCNKKNCEENHTANLIITNQTLESIEFYFDGVYLYNMMKLTTETLEVTTGTHVYGGKSQNSIYSDSLKWQFTRNFSDCQTEKQTFQ